MNSAIEDIKLTTAQRKVIDLLKRGECIIHNDRNFMVSDGYDSHVIQWRVWNALTKEKKLIMQQLSLPFEYVLTENVNKYL